jgi:hypothetical protein
MKKIITLIIVSLFVSCTANNDPEDVTVRTSYERVIPKENKKEYAEWLLQGMKNANPHSDEEPEDMIRQLEWTGLEVFGVEEAFYTYKSATGFGENYNSYYKIRVKDWTPEKDKEIREILTRGVK